MTPHLKAIREFEIARCLEFFPANASILEVGAGSGWQAARLAAGGHTVCAIEVAASHYLADAVFPVSVYDGRHIPFPDAHFDVVFSSNVLEHVTHLNELNQDIHRVLKPGGIVVHVLPTATWRLWTSVSHYANAAKRAGVSSIWSAAASPLKVLATVLKAGQPVRHGESGGVWTEIYLFSRFRWRPVFSRLGWKVKRRLSLGLFYTGYSVLDARLPINLRRRMARVCGSACQAFVLENAR